MKKSKLSIGLMTALVSVGALAGCDNAVKSSNTGVLISFDGKDYSASDILKEDFKDTSKYQSIYDTVYSLIVRNYFNVDGLSVKNPQYVQKGDHFEINEKEIKLGKADLSEIEKRAEDKITIDRETARTNANNNNSNEKKELEAICSAQGVEYDKKLTNLKEKYIKDIKKEMFDKDFYNYYMKDLILGPGATEDGYSMSEDVKKTWEGYFENQVPYHISHILVKLEDSANKYADGTISEANARKLYEVVNQIAFGKDTFARLAKVLFNDDSGSAADKGNLGIMTTTTSYVDEFKLGVYAYENIYEPMIKGGTTKVAEGSKVELDEETKEKFNAEVTKSFELKEGEIPTVDFSVFEELYEYRDVTRSDNKKPVIDDSTLVYPRNIIYNKSLNRHSVSFITGPEELAIFPDGDAEMKYVEVAQEGEGVKEVNGKFYKAVDAKTIGTGFYQFQEGEKPILAVKVAGEWQPVLCVRAGSDYQGIHFIVVNRSPFTEMDKNGVSLENYYTPYYPDQKESYPKYEVAEGEFKGDMETYVNFSTDEMTEQKQKAEKLASDFKSFDSDRLGKYIFKKFAEIENIKFKDEELNTKFNEWIETSLEKKEEERKEAWDKKWTDYIDTLARQDAERSKLVSNTCKLTFKHTNAEYTLGYLVSEKGLNKEELYADIENYYFGNKTVSLYEADGKTKITLTGDVEADEEILENILVDQIFTVKGGLCNDGKDHK